MKKDALFSKKVKAVIASAMALTLAIPSVVMLNGTTPVQAEVELPDPIAVYNFEDTAAEGITMVENSVKPTIATEEGRSGNVFTLGDSVVTDAVIEVTTSASVDENGNPIVVENETVVKEAEYAYSEAVVENPFKGMTELDEDPAFSEDGAGNPIWEKGVTISYWQKATDTDSSVISFSNSREGVIQKDDRIKYDLFKMYEEDPTNPLFSVGTPEAITFQDRMKWKDDKQIKGGVNGEAYTILDGCGPFVKFNPNYQAGSYYLKPETTVKNGEKVVKWYILTNIDNDTDKKAGPIKMEDYNDPTSATTQLKTGTTEGGLQFNSSGAWGYVECGTITLYQGSTIFGKASVSQGNHAVAHAYLTGVDANGQSADVYQPDALINKANEWHYITRVIKNDSVSTYVDGVLKNREIYTDRTNAGSVDVNKGFNCGWGYYESSDSDDPIIIQKYTTSIFDNADSFTIAPKMGSYEMRDYSDEIILGYNGNTNGMTIMEMLIDENTTLSFGGQSLGMESVFTYITETQAGTAIDNVAFFAEPLSSEQVAALYAQAQQSDIVVPDKPIGPTPSEPVTGAPVSPAPSEPSVSPVPSTPSTDIPVSPTPSTPADEVMLGDVDGNKKVELADAQEALKAALKITTLDAKQTEAADVDKNAVVDLTDAQLILKYALKIIDKF